MTATGMAPRIMIVDDIPENLGLLKRMLQDLGCEVVTHSSGPMAIRAVERRAPELILLDISMPEMDGFEVCRRLKRNPATRAVPIIFLSALDATEDKVRAFQLGGEDYITKPFQFEELKARVLTRIQLHRTQCELEARNLDLEASYRKLQEAESMRDALVHMVVHDMRNLLQPMVLNLDLLGEMAAERLVESGAATLQRVKASTGQLTELISTVLDVSKLESGAMELRAQSCDLGQLAAEVLEPLRVLQDQGILRLEAPAVPVLAHCDPALVGRVILNLVANALKFTPRQPGAVRLDCLQTSAIEVALTVTDRGPGIAPEDRELIFQKFRQGGTSHGRRDGTGLGLAFARMAVEAHGGVIGLTSEVGVGSSFRFTLPAPAR